MKIQEKDGKINNVYGTPFISSIRRSSVKPKTTIYNPDDINPGRTVWRYTEKKRPTSRLINVHKPIQFTVNIN